VDIPEFFHVSGAGAELIRSASRCLPDEADELRLPGIRKLRAEARSVDLECLPASPRWHQRSVSSHPPSQDPEADVRMRRGEGHRCIPQCRRRTTHVQLHTEEMIAKPAREVRSSCVANEANLLDDK
jgi:hypothetical protein